MRSCTSIVESCKYTRRTAFFNELADDLVVEEVDGCPFDLFTDVFLLLRFEGKLDEYLLEFLVDIVDAELLE